MPPSLLLAPTAPGRAEQHSTRAAFLILGLAAGAWAPLVPFAKVQAGLNDGTLGLVLLSLGAGSVAAMLPAGALAGRYGCRRVLVAAAALICLVLPVLVAGGGVAVLVAALLAFGAGMGALDCAVNIQGVIVQRRSGRAMMSGFHGLYSLGGIAGAGGVAALLAAGVPPVGAALCLSAVMAAVLAWAAPHFLPYGGGGGPVFALPRGAVLLIGVLCCVAFLAEGSVMDWSAVFLVSARGADPAVAALGYAAFSCTMTVGRLVGDAAVRRLGGTRLVVGGALCAASGLGLSVLAPGPAAGIAGFALVGAGCANIVPVLFTAVGRQTAMPEGVAIPAVTTIGYAGILAGPGAIGLFAHATSLAAAFGVVAALLLGLAALARRVRP